ATSTKRPAIALPGLCRRVDLSMLALSSPLMPIGANSGGGRQSRPRLQVQRPEPESGLFV
ncbi:MAG: hypothetical protein ACQES4_01970, partial [Bacillota bacterium]